MNSSLLSDLDIARLESPGARDASLVRKLARETVRELQLQAPVDPALVASYRGIARIEEVNQPWAGCLTTKDDETVARVRASDGRRRKRFTALHEVKHTYLPGFAVTQYRCDPTPGGTSRSPLRTDGPDLERLADIGASELLFPHNEFIADVAGNRIDFDLVDDLAEHYDASLVATAIRTVTLAPDDTFLLCVEPGTKPTAPIDEPVPRIQWSATSGDWPHLPRFKSIPDGSPIHRAFVGELVDEITDLNDLTRSPINHVDISCRLYPYVDHQGQHHDRVLCIATRR